MKAGYQVTIWNRSADKCKDLAAEGAKVASSSQRKQLLQLTSLLPCWLIPRQP